jgi:hypothetical protein
MGIRKPPQKDPHVAIVAAIAAATGQPMPSGEDLLGSEELKRKFRKAGKSPRRK